MEFNDQVQINESSPAQPFDEESDLTDLTEVEEAIAAISPSPRRLRSKGDKEKPDEHRGRQKADREAEGLGRRVTPMRNAKKKMGSLREEDDEEDELDELDESEVDQDEEIDQLAMSPSAMDTPKASSLRTPVKRRLRPRRIQTHTPPSDGDDEESETEGANEQHGEDGSGDENEGDDERSVASEDVEECEPPPAIEPRKLRNGKIVTDDDGESIGEEDEEDEEDKDDHDSVDDDVDLEDGLDDGEETDEPMDDDSRCLFPASS